MEDNSQKFLDMISEYKQMRRDPERRAESIKLREQAYALLETGTVSAQAEEASRYI